MRLMVLSQPDGEVLYLNPRALAAIRLGSGVYSSPMTELRLIDGSTLWVKDNIGVVARYWEREQARHMAEISPAEEIQSEPQD